MKKPILTSAQAAYEPPYAEIIEFTVEEGFVGSGEDVFSGYDSINGTETLGRDDVSESWY